MLAAGTVTPLCKECFEKAQAQEEGEILPMTLEQRAELAKFLRDRKGGPS